MGSVVNTEKLDAQAAQWLIRSEAPSFTPQDQAAFEEWLAADPRHRAVYMRLASAWGKAEQLRRLRPFDGAVNENLLTEATLPSLQRTESPPRRRIWRQLAIAAATVLLLLAALVTARLLIRHFTWQTYATDIGGFERVVLPDGSTVNMNTNSRIRVRFISGRREVGLDRGEALFTVARDEQRPFDVQAGGSVIRAMGTVFSVRLGTAQGVDVLVTQGHVIIDPPKESALPSGPRSSPASTLSAGETVNIKAHSLHIAKVDARQMARKTAWTKGQLVFEQQTLEEIAAEFNRYNRRQLEIADPSIAQLRMSAGFDATDPDSFVVALERAYGVKAFQSEEGVVRLVGTEGNQGSAQ